MSELSTDGAEPPTGLEVLIVDDDPLVRAGLRLILGGSRDIVIVGEAGDGAEGVAMARRLRPDVVLMDIRMPRLDGIAATEQLVADDDAPRVIVLTTFDADDYVVRALAQGAHGFLLKDTPPAQLVEAIRKVAAGEPTLSPSVTAQLIRHVAGSQAADASADERGASARARLAGLTEREQDVARALGRGASNAQISAQLYMSVATVKAHISRLLTKLDAQNRVQVALIVHDAES
jgi:DNA-binding NarL/FixJ family response regulator